MRLKEAYKVKSQSKKAEFMREELYITARQTSAELGCTVKPGFHSDAIACVACVALTEHSYCNVM